MTIYYWICFLLISGVIIGFFYRKKFFDINKRLFVYMENSQSFQTRLDTIEATFSLTGSWTWNLFKLYSDGKSLILIDNFDLDKNLNSKLYAKTYLITGKDLVMNYPIDLFKNIVTVSKITLDKDNNIIISGAMQYQTLIPKLAWVRHSKDLTIKIKKPHDNFDFDKLIKYAR